MTDQRPIGFWLKLVDRLVDERFNETLDEHGVTRRQWQLLNVLGQRPATREELDDAVAPFLVATGTDGGADAAAVSTAGSTAGSTAAEIDELVESDWVAASPSGFALTPRGESAFERLSVVVGGIRAHLSAGLTADEYETTVRSLERMARNLGWQERATP